MLILVKFVAASFCYGATSFNDAVLTYSLELFQTLSPFTSSYTYMEMHIALL